MSFIKQYISKASIVVAVMFVPVLVFATPDHPAITVNAHIQHIVDTTLQIQYFWSLMVIISLEPPYHQSIIKLLPQPHNRLLLPLKVKAIWLSMSVMVLLHVLGGDSL